MPSIEGVNTCASCGRKYFYSEAGGACPKCGCMVKGAPGLPASKSVIGDIIGYILIIPFLPIILIMRIFKLDGDFKKYK